MPRKSRRRAEGRGGWRGKVLRRIAWKDGVTRKDLWSRHHGTVTPVGTGQSWWCGAVPPACSALVPCPQCSACEVGTDLFIFGEESEALSGAGT